MGYVTFLLKRLLVLLEVIRGEQEGNADYGGMVQPSQQHVALCVKGVKWKLGTRGLRMEAAFWTGIPVEVGVFYTPPIGGNLIHIFSLYYSNL